MNQGLRSGLQPGNLEDDLARLGQVDWIVEVVVERLDVKRQVLARIEVRVEAGDTRDNEHIRTLGCGDG